MSIINKFLDKFSNNSLATPQEKRQKFLLIVLAVIVIAIAVILYFSFWSPDSPRPVNTEEPTAANSCSVKELVNKIDFDASFFNNSQFQNLQTYGEWPLSIGEKGRINPFLPY